MNLFGKKKVATGQTPTPVVAIGELRNQLERLEKRESLMSQRILQSKQEALRKKSINDTKGALFELKRKKMFDAEVAKLQGARITLDAQIMALESSAINMETVKAMKLGADAMKNIHGNLDADKVDDLLDSIQEQKEIHDTISEAISRPGNEMFDDEELLRELEELDELSIEQSVAVGDKKTAPNTAKSISLPIEPTSSVQVQGFSSNRAESDEEREIRELQASMLA